MSETLVEVINLPVASGTPVPKLANSIFYHSIEGKKVVVTALGRWANNQVIKAISRAKTKLEEKGIRLLIEVSMSTAKGRRDNDEVDVTEFTFQYLVADTLSDTLLETSSETL
jgi:stage V sporulation protein SpoVS